VGRRNFVGFLVFFFYFWAFSWNAGEFHRMGEGKAGVGTSRLRTPHSRMLGIHFLRTGGWEERRPLVTVLTICAEQKGPEFAVSFVHSTIIHLASSMYCVCSLLAVGNVKMRELELKACKIESLT
jgi:hypothetical protein